MLAPQVMNSNPEFAQLLNNPEMLRDSLRMAANPVRIQPRRPFASQCAQRPCMQALRCGDVKLHTAWSHSATTLMRLCGRRSCGSKCDPMTGR